MTRHPAKFSKQLLPTILAWLDGIDGPVLDPFAGVGAGAIPGLIHSELEPEWTAMCPSPAIVADALRLPIASGRVAAVVTSPTYGNRMADHHVAQDASRRNTYTHAMGRQLHGSNSGTLQWGEAYREFHAAAWREVRRVLRPGGTFILNIKDHIRKGQPQYVPGWHARTLLDLGFTMDDLARIPCPGNRQGANGAARVDHELLYRFTRP